MSYIGTLKSRALRERLQEQLEAAGSDVIWMTPSSPDQGASETMIAIQEHSVFCLQPYGDSDTRKSFYDALLSGLLILWDHNFALLSLF